MLKKRIIPCLDVKDGRTVKGTNFVALKDMGDPVQLGKRYADEGADELVFLDITASIESRKTMREIVRRVAEVINIPFTVGGGISSLEDAKALLENGADKVSINTAAVKNPALISEISTAFGRQSLVLAIDAGFVLNEWLVFIYGGREKTDHKVLTWALEGERLGAGEILLTSIERDGTSSGFEIELTREVSRNLRIPVIASGGGGSPESFYEVFEKGEADAALAAGIFHRKEVSIKMLKNLLKDRGVAIRL